MAAAAKKGERRCASTVCLGTSGLCGRRSEGEPLYAGRSLTLRTPTLAPPLAPRALWPPSSSARRLPWLEATRLLCAMKLRFRSIVVVDAAAEKVAGWEGGAIQKPADRQTEKRTA